MRGAGTGLRYILLGLMKAIPDVPDFPDPRRSCKERAPGIQRFRRRDTCSLTHGVHEHVPSCSTG